MLVIFVANHCPSGRTFREQHIIRYDEWLFASLAEIELKNSFGQSISAVVCFGKKGSQRRALPRPPQKDYAQLHFAAETVSFLNASSLKRFVSRIYFGLVPYLM